MRVTLLKFRSQGFVCGKKGERGREVGFMGGLGGKMG